MVRGPVQPTILNRPSQGETPVPTPMDSLWQDNAEERAASDPALLIDVAGFPFG